MHPYLAYLLIWDSPTRVSPDSELYASVASTRLRALIPARELARSVPTWILPLQRLLDGGALPPGALPAAAVLGKLATSTLQKRLQAARNLIGWLDAHAERVRLFADVSDNYTALDQPILREYQETLLRACTLVVPCEALKAELAPHAKRGIHVVEDAYELAHGAPRVYRGGRMHLCWFGTFAGPTRGAVERMLGDLVAHLRGREVRFDLVTGPLHQRDAALQLGAALAQRHPGLEFVVTDWSRERTERVLADCHFVLLPQDADSEWGRVKSHNRLVEAIRAGRLALASPIPSYLELGDFAWVGSDLRAGLDWAVANPDAAEARIRSGQAYIETRFSPAAVGRRWAEVLGIAAGAPRPGGAGPGPSGAAVRLNLGCGDKILAGYVNVDVAPSRAGKPPDVLCDLRALTPFASGSVDEAMAIHVVEHFWRWEVVDVLREWVRVLRPGGRMILECPNLLTACEEMLRDPIAGAQPGPAGQRTMWVLYGDPAWQDPLMCHRWNYTPQSLRQVMEEAGLVNVRQEPAEFKLREPRDMRLVGDKPGG